MACVQFMAWCVQTQRVDSLSGWNLLQGCQFSGYCRNSGFFKFPPNFSGTPCFIWPEKKILFENRFSALRISSARRKCILLKTDFRRSVFHLAKENLLIKNLFPVHRILSGRRKYYVPSTRRQLNHYADGMYELVFTQGVSDQLTKSAVRTTHAVPINYSKCCCRCCTSPVKMQDGGRRLCWHVALDRSSWSLKKRL